MTTLAHSCGRESGALGLGRAVVTVRAGEFERCVLLVAEIVRPRTRAARRCYGSEYATNESE
jgi:hypothetical protein